MAPTKGRFFACSASVGAFLGAAAALVPASCGGTVQNANGGGGSGSGAAGGGATGTGNMSTGGMDGGTMLHDGDDLDGTLVDLDGDADAHHHPGEGGDADMS